MDEKTLRRRGWLCGCAAPLGALCWFLTAMAWGTYTGNPDEGMGAALWVLPIPVIGVLTAGYWLITWALERKHFAKVPLGLILWNLFALAAGLFFLIPLLYL